MQPSHVIDAIASLFERHGHRAYDDARQERVTALEHALQCAQLAEWSHAGDRLVAAALLHDIGHLMATDLPDDVDDAHENRALPLLVRAFGPAVTEPVRLHVQAKRYLVRRDAGYASRLTPASLHSLQFQGGPFVDTELAAFEDLPYALDAVHLRRWDDLAKDPGQRTPPLAHYLALLEEVALPRMPDERRAIGVLDLS